MKLLLKATCLTAVVCATSLALAVDTPFAGTWKLNLDKSRLVGDTVTFTPAGEEMRFTGGGESYAFKTDGSEKKTRFGRAAGKKLEEEIRGDKGNCASLLVISDAENGLSFEEPDFKMKASGAFDGKPGNVEGPTIPSGASFFLTKVSARRFKMTRTQSGKPFDQSTWTVSLNGKLLNVVSRTAGTTDPPTTAVYEKQ